MKLLMTTDGAGGVLTYSVQLSRMLAQAGVDVLLASMGPPLSPGQRAEAQAASARVIEAPYRLEWMDDPWPDVERAGEWLLELEREHAPDVIHVNGYAHAALPWRAPALLVAHSCVCSWWRAVLGERAPERYARYRAEVTRGLAAAQLTIAPTEAMLQCLVEEYAEVRRPLVIHNGVHLPPPPSQPKEAFVLSAGRVWDRAKNIAQLEHAAARGLPWPVFVAGDAQSPDGREAPALAHVVALGLLDRQALGGWMARAAVFALPALYEPFGLSILEAAAAGCALVIGDIPSLRELWGDAALYVAPTDPEALQRVLARLCSEPAEQARLGQRAYERAQRYGAQPMAERYLAVYRGLARRERTQPRRIEMEMAR